MHRERERRRRRRKRKMSCPRKPPTVRYHREACSEPRYEPVTPDSHCRCEPASYQPHLTLPSPTMVFFFVAGQLPCGRIHACASGRWVCANTICFTRNFFVSLAKHKSTTPRTAFVDCSCRSSTRFISSNKFLKNHCFSDTSPSSNTHRTST